MKKAIFSTAVALLIGFGANAQRIDIGVNVPLGLPQGDVADGLGFGVGGGVFAKYFVTDNIAAGVSFDFLSFAGEDVDGVEGIGSTLMPIMLTGDYHFMPDEDFDFYAGLGVGYFMVGGDYGDALDALDLNTGGLGLSPRVGLNYAFTDQLRLNFSAGYSLGFTGDSYTETFDPGFGLPVQEITVESADFNFISINLGVAYDIGG